MLDGILPDSVVTVEVFGNDAPWDAVLFPGEHAFVEKAVEKRRREFTVVRSCARRAMEKLGVPPQAVLPGERGAPLWPAGVIGSMTHCDGYCAAALAPAGDLEVLGIDAEPHLALPAGVEKTVTLPVERERLRRLASDDPTVCWDRLLFSAKESVYKAWFPAARKWLDFSEAEIEFFPGDGATGDLRAVLLVPGPVLAGRRIRSFEGRWAVRHGLVTTAVTAAHG
ncbi:4'-phosphopantetheinyl transferase superfamily protein [Streptomyces sp. ISL-100]|uniref:4'-phosphopantetheinyl transferase family protein n=1 Tax=Streptomyces sp. ISL-100 TaxID=2819173 RepID=UPI001BE7F781|nr:4'-phosphopantetheinyl transferase superfamily protein [Streptomyces sp. ISL-100]MBT2397109.1 4'-phosphopantetheinyl transferase superfamily protein [Streptomyces sp. ISL-100]